jgi:DNA-binding IclR family transcriptional regulator
VADPAARVTGSQTLDRGLHAIRMIGESVDGATAGELAQMLAIRPASAYRLLRSLTEYGFVRRDPDGRYRLGVALVQLATQSRYGLRSAALPVMRSLAETVGATAMLLVADGTEAVVLAAVEPSRISYRIQFLEGHRHPLDRGSASYAMRATHPPTAGEPEAVSCARALGYAMSEGEVIPGAFGLAMALDRARIGMDACLNLSSNDDRVLQVAVPVLRKAAGELTDIFDPRSGAPDQGEAAEPADDDPAEN